MATAMDLNLLRERNGTALDILSKEDPEFFEALVRIVVDYVRLTSPSTHVVSYLPSALQQAEDVEMIYAMGWALEQMMKQVVMASAGEETKEYSTGELAGMFGVSITTINNWIKKGKIVYQREGRGKHAAVPESAIWIGAEGERIRIADVAAEYRSRLQQYAENAEHDRDIITSEIRRLEAKYNGPYELTLKRMADKTVVQERDSELWQYYLSIMGMQE